MAEPATTPFVVLDPKCIPAGPIACGLLEPAVHAALLRLHRDAGEALRAGWSIDTPLDAALAQLPVPEPEPGSDDDAVPYDRFHALHRLRARPAIAAAGFARAIVLALQRYQLEARGASSRGNAWRGTAATLLGLLGRYLHLPPEPGLPPAPPPPGEPGAGEPLRRWVHAHQILAVLEQGAVWALHSFDAALRSGCPARAKAALEFATELLGARAPVQRFAASGPPQRFEAEVGTRLVKHFGAAGPGASPDCRYLRARAAQLAGPFEAAARLHPQATVRLLGALDKLAEPRGTVAYAASATAL